MAVTVTDKPTVGNPNNPPVTRSRPDTVHPQPKLTDADCQDIADLEFVQYESGVVHFKNVIDVDADLILPYVDEQAQPSNCGLKWMEKNGERWAEDYQGNHHDISILLEQPYRLGGLGEHEPVMKGTPEPVVEFFNQCEMVFYKCLVRYIDLYPMILNTIWWKMRGHVLHYKSGALLGLHNDNDSNFRVIDGQRYETERAIAMYQVLNGMIDIGDGAYEGGEFVFPISKCSIKTHTGDAVFFPANYLGSHGVSKVTSGQRYSYLTQFGQGQAPGGEIMEATESYGWLPPVYLPWIFQDYERFFKSGHSKSSETWMQYHGGGEGSAGSYDAISVANPVSQQRALEGDPAGVYQPYRD